MDDEHTKCGDKQPRSDVSGECIFEHSTSVTFYSCQVAIHGGTSTRRPDLKSRSTSLSLVHSFNTCIPKPRHMFSV